MCVMVQIFNCVIAWYQLVHQIGSAHLMISYSVFCFLVIIQCMGLSLIYCTLFKPCPGDRMINLLMGLSLLVITETFECFTSINAFICTTSLWSKGVFSPFYTWGTKRLISKVYTLGVQFETPSIWYLSWVFSLLKHFLCSKIQLSLTSVSVVDAQHFWNLSEGSQIKHSNWEPLLGKACETFGF